MRTGKSFPIGALLILAVAVLASCGGTSSSWCPCPAPLFELTVTTASGEAANGVVASVSGPTTGAMDCSPTTGNATLCYLGTSTSGTYSVQVTAPGFQAANVSAVVSVATATTGACICETVTTSPSNLSVTLNPS